MKLKQLPIPFRYVLIAAFILSLLMAVHDSMSYYVYERGKWYGWCGTLVIPLINYGLWAFLVPIVYHLIHLFPPKNLSIGQKGVHILMGLGIALVHEVVSNTLYVIWIYANDFMPIDQSFLQKRLETIPFAMSMRFIEYWIIVGGLLAIDISQRYRDQQTRLLKIERDLSESKLSALKMQLQPHFLFNTLNTISALMEMSIPDAQKVVSRLGKLLRNMLDNEQQQFISLEQELSYIKAYLDIEQTRFSDRLSVKYEIENEALFLLVPNLILQPLVENAIKHGISKNKDPGEIVLRAKIKEDKLLLEVSDNGPGHPAPTQIAQKPGIGLSNVMNRLKQLYKVNFDFKIKSVPSNGFTVCIGIPVMQSNL